MELRVGNFTKFTVDYLKTGILRACKNAKFTFTFPHSSLKGMTPSECKEFLKKGEKIK